ncbi:hypothetical protein F5148DRAFT_413145 [Russula earlei]|uniref:Uncharacterized protein n=1 Tax=Russula earlei TaxID=71964 RepID=A0ACC0TZP7_9AGAM|nr:hypothetical protein F5148DRAFT_413145 [Russula earlei]
MMPLERGQEFQFGLDTDDSVTPEHSSFSTQTEYLSYSKPSSTRHSSMPPPYDGLSSSGNSPLPSQFSSRAATPMPHQLRPPHEGTSRRLPNPPIIEIPAERATGMTGPSQLESSDSLTPHSQSPPTPSPSSSRTSPLTPQSPADSPSRLLSVPPAAKTARSRSVFRPFSALRLPRATAQITNQAAQRVAEEVRLRTAEEQAARRALEQAAREREENEARRAAAQAKARKRVGSCIQPLLVSRHASEEDCIAVFSECAQACRNGGLDLSAVLQEPIVEGQTPVYWAILNRSSPSDADDALIAALLNACGPLNETTMDAVRAACTLTSNNALLQHLFGQFPGLSPLSVSDALLLGPSGAGDIVDVEETRDGSVAFTAYIKIRRFRIRMKVSKVVKVEFVTRGMPFPGKGKQRSADFHERRADLDGRVHVDRWTWARRSF